MAQGLLSGHLCLCHPSLWLTVTPRAASGRQGFGCGPRCGAVVRDPRSQPRSPGHGSVSRDSPARSSIFRATFYMTTAPNEGEESARRHYGTTEEEARTGTAGISPAFPRVNFQTSLDRQGPASPRAEAKQAYAKLPPLPWVQQNPFTLHKQTSAVCS